MYSSRSVSSELSFAIKSFYLNVESINGQAKEHLFGYGVSPGNKICSGPNGTGTCVTALNLSIFDKAALTQIPVATWSAVNSRNNPSKQEPFELIYTKYTVTTVDNPIFGIKAGTIGTLHALTAARADADTALQDIKKDRDFKADADMLNFISSDLSIPDTNKNTGLNYLKATFGL